MLRTLNKVTMKNIIEQVQLPQLNQTSPSTMVVKSQDQTYFMKNTQVHTLCRVSLVIIFY